MIGEYTQFQIDAIQRHIVAWDTHLLTLPDDHPDRSAYSGVDVVLAAMDRTGRAKTPSLNYLESLLNNWRKSGVNLNGKRGHSGSPDGRAAAARQQLRKEGLM